MSSEITGQVSVYCSNGNYKGQFNQTLAIDQAAQGAAAGIHTVTTSEGNLSLGDVTTAGVCCLQSLEPTGGNYVDWGLDDSSTLKAIGRLAPGEVAVFRLVPSVNLRMKAHTASVSVAYWVLQA